MATRGSGARNWEDDEAEEAARLKRLGRITMPIPQQVDMGRTCHQEDRSVMVETRIGVASRYWLTQQRPAGQSLGIRYQCFSGMLYQSRQRGLEELGARQIFEIRLQCILYFLSMERTLDYGTVVEVAAD